MSRGGDAGRQDFPAFQGQITYADRVHKDGYTLDRNGDRWRETWRPRRGLSRLAAITAAKITAIGDVLVRDGRRFLLTVDGDGKWISTVLPAVVWDD